MFAMASNSAIDQGDAIEGNEYTMYSIREGSPEEPNLSQVSNDGLRASTSSERTFSRQSLSIDLDSKQSRTIAVEGGPRRSFAVESRESFTLDVLARKSIDLEGIWQGEGDPRRSFGSVDCKRRRSWSVDVPAGQNVQTDQLRSPSETDHRKSTSKTVLLVPPEGQEKNGCGLDIFKLSPLKETSDTMSNSELQGTLPVSVKFVDIKYSLSTEHRSFWSTVTKLGARVTSTKDKVILNGVTGVVHPGEMMGLLGPSGSGKTTLLRVLAGRTQKYQGSVLYNEMPLVKAMNRRIGFVSQDDVLYPHLTVKETLVYAALLRLPRDFSRQEKIKRAQDVIMELGLEKCQGTIVGGPWLRGVSGGERKRVSIGTEMLIDPGLLLLDEPTSGLDSTTALSLVRILRRLALGGKTILSTIHQPSSVIYHMFDKIVVLSDGYSIFYGKGSGALDYFASIGFPPTFATNPADFLLELANGITYNLEDLNNETSPDDHESNRQPVKDNVDDRMKVKEILRESYITHLLEESRLEIRESRPTDAKGVGEIIMKQEWTTTWLEQFIILFKRSMRERRHESYSSPRVLETLLVAIIAGLIWLPHDNESSSSRIQDQVGLLFFSGVFWGFFSLYNSIFTFPLEREMLSKERASGMYRLSAYFFAQSMVDVPMELMLPSIYIIIIYWMGGLKANFVAFILTWVALFVNVLAAQGMGLMIGAICMNLKRASTLASVMMNLCLLAGGFYAKDLAPIFKWLRYISFSFHAFKLEVNAQYGEDDTYTCQTGQCRVADIDSVRSVGLGGELSSALAMLGLLLGFRFIAYLALRRTKR